jgi:hypothetical protein
MPTVTRTVCRPDQHDFVPKKQRTSSESMANVMDISEVFCRKCGTVCFLTTQEPAAEPSRIKVISAAN